MRDAVKGSKTALGYLEAGYVLSDAKHNSFRYYEGHVWVSSENASYKLTQESFEELFSQTSFRIDEEKTGEEEIDVKKDEEYYHFRQ